MSDDAAIQQDVVDDREAVIEEIQRRRMATMEDDGAEIPDELEEEEGEQEEGGADNAPQADTDMVVFRGEDGTDYRIPKTAKLTAKVDGQEVEQQVESLLRGHQKALAADKRLQEASERQRQLAQYEAALKKRESEISENLSKRLSPDAYKEKANKLISAVLEEDNDAVAELLAEVGGRGEAPTINVEQIKAEAAAMAKNDIALDDANTWFHEHNKDIADDPVLFDLANRRTAELHQLNPDWPPMKIIKQAAEETRMWLESRTPGTRETRKRESASPQPRTSGRAEVGRDAAPPPTRKDIISEMRAERGLPPL